MKCLVYLDEGMCMPSLKRQAVVTTKNPSSMLIHVPYKMEQLN